MAITFCISPSPSVYGLTGHSGNIMGDSILNRISYHFIHANLPHLILNSWSLLAICFYTRPRTSYLLISFLIASLYPYSFFSTSTATVPDAFPSGSHILPIIGMSGTIYALVGILFFYRSNKISLLITTATYSILGLYLGTIAVGLHLFCLFLGILYGLLFTNIFPD